MGKPVVLPENVKKDKKKLIDKGWLDNAFNQYISDLISVKRTLPDVRDPGLVFIYTFLCFKILLFFLNFI